MDGVLAGFALGVLSFLAGVALPDDEPESLDGEDDDDEESDVDDSDFFSARSPRFASDFESLL
ncbi:hypothetical protein [Cryobacterium frigoriphilum]|uniref:hypothetical protein n=1 Tax=Cryobacterium frigoriphilum TaxID=1259150 RepID=UPI0030B9B658